MKKTTFFLAAFIAVSVLSLAFATKKSYVTTSEKIFVVKDSSASKESTANTAVAALSTTLMHNLDLEALGLKTPAVEIAVKGYLKLKEEGKLQNPNLLTIVDMSQSGRSKRFYLLDVKNQKLLINTFVAHGMMSGVDMATNFSNDLNSNESSLGFYVTKDTYAGKHGMSLRLSGLEPNFNDNAEARGIVVHSADYVNAGRVNSEYMGRSEGCPALPSNVYQQVINLIKGGSALFIYYPDQNYLSTSQFLNS